MTMHLLWLVVTDDSIKDETIFYYQKPQGIWLSALSIVIVI